MDCDFGEILYQNDEATIVLSKMIPALNFLSKRNNDLNKLSLSPLANEVHSQIQALIQTSINELVYSCTKFERPSVIESMKNLNLIKK